MTNKKTFDIHDIKLILRNILFFISVILYLWHKQFFLKIVNLNIGPIAIYHMIWLLLIIEMLFIMIPAFNNYTSYGKCYKKHYNEAQNIDYERLKAYTQHYNKRALVTIILWMFFLIGLGIIFYNHIIDQYEIYFLTMFLYALDQIFVVFWCPIREFIVQNKCCNSCRIHNWDYLMIFSPLIFELNIWTITLLGLSFTLMVIWEVSNYRYPERFSEISNMNLRCGQCHSKCRINKETSNVFMCYYKLLKLKK